MRRNGPVITAVFLFLSSVGCGPVYYPVPAQRKAQPQAVEMLLDMTPGRPPELWGSVASGIRADGGAGADWRWAGEQSEFSFTPIEGAWSLVAHLTAVQSVLDRTGAQKVAFSVNGRSVGSADIFESRRYDLKFPATLELKGAGPVTVTMSVSPCLKTQNGPAFCVLLHSIGLVQFPGAESR